MNICFRANLLQLAFLQFSTLIDKLRCEPQKQSMTQKIFRCKWEKLGGFAPLSKYACEGEGWIYKSSIHVFLTPLFERSCHSLEIGPKETGKIGIYYIIQKISYSMEMLNSPLFASCQWCIFSHLFYIHVYLNQSSMNVHRTQNSRNLCQ